MEAEIEPHTVKNNVSASPLANQKRRTTQKALVAFAVVGIIAFTFSSAWIDTLDQQWTSCTVTSAEPVQGNNRSVTPWRVDIRTHECGSIGYLQAFSEDTAQAVATELLAGEAYEFKFGIISRAAASLRLPIVTPSAKDIRTIKQH